ncbi:hypothetical protein TSAR_000287 [Trichomalopsis sarcophagae]|uniref:Uncharacterized protein n=1 Tax=Trichomalopsis sarcophagae TaxID=543379 RepID=A0A232EEJ4_9HYME|nr:hypothetical protein TSAR_000287 [Trichomalopsis sarcophagae]
MTNLEETVEQDAAEKSKEIVELRRDITVYIRETDDRAALEDMAESSVSGIARSLGSNIRQAIGRMLAYVGMASQTAFIVGMREWPKRTITGENHAAEPVKHITADSIVRFCSTAVRNTVLSSAYLLDKLSLKDILGCPGSGKIYMSPLYPKYVYLLNKKTRKVTKNLSYALPIRQKYGELSSTPRQNHAECAQIYCHCFPNRLKQALATVQADAQAMSDWATENILSLNLAKCKVMILGSQAYISRIDTNNLQKITVNNVPLFVTEACNLGV